MKLLSMLLFGSSALLFCACSQQQTKQEMKKGPQQQSFQHCDAEDSECEEGAASDILQIIPEIRAVAEIPSVATVVEPEQNPPIAIVPQDSSQK